MSLNTMIHTRCRPLIGCCLTRSKSDKKGKSSDLSTKLTEKLEVVQKKTASAILETGKRVDDTVMKVGKKAENLSKQAVIKMDELHKANVPDNVSERAEAAKLEALKIEAKAKMAANEAAKKMNDLRNKANEKLSNKDKKKK